MLDRCSATLVSGSDLLKHWRATHSLDRCSAMLISGSDLLKHWKATHSLVTFLAIPFNSSYVLRHYRVTHLLKGCLALLISGSNLLKQLTFWMYVQPFSSVVSICLKTLLTAWMCVQTFLSMVLICSLWSHSHPRDISKSTLVKSMSTSYCLTFSPFKKLSGFNNLPKKNHIHTASSIP